MQRVVDLYLSSSLLEKRGNLRIYDSAACLRSLFSLADVDQDPINYSILSPTNNDALLCKKQNQSNTTTTRSQPFCIFPINLVHDYYIFDVFFQLEACFHMQGSWPHMLDHLIPHGSASKKIEKQGIFKSTESLFGAVGGSPLGIWLDCCVNQNWKLEPPTLLLLL